MILRAMANDQPAGQGVGIAVPMTFTEHPGRLARVAGALCLIITACALYACLYVREHVIVSDDMARTAANLLAH
jgi:hypothetical protein